MSDHIHWMENEQFRARFWATAGELGLGHEDVHQIFGVQSMKDYTGTLTDAMAILNAANPEQPPVPPEPALDRLLFEHCAQLPEAPALAWTKFYTQTGFEWSITLRAGLTNKLAVEALGAIRKQIELFERGAKVYHWTPKLNGVPASPVASYGPVPTGQPTAPPPASNAPPPVPVGASPSPPATANGGEIQRGTARLSKITVDAEGKVQFYCDGFRYPFKDGRGGETVAALFDASAGGWTAAHFAPGSLYDNVKHLVADWEKPSKYYNVVRIRAA